MNIIECGKAFLQWLVALANRTAWEWRQCLHCGSWETEKWGWYRRRRRGRNHRSEPRLERAALLWAIYRNFTPAQRRSKRKRRYRHPGQRPLTVAGAPPGRVSYLDALGV